MLPSALTMAAAGCGGGSGAKNFTRDEIHGILAVAPPQSDGMTWTEDDTVRPASLRELRRALGPPGPFKNEIDQLGDAGFERVFVRAWASGGHSAEGRVSLFRDRAGADEGFDALQHLTPSWFFPVLVSDLGDEAVSAEAEPGAVYMWRRENIVLAAWMFQGSGTPFDFGAAARAYADKLDG